MNQVRLLPITCAVCGKILLAGRVAMDLWGNTYCEKHRHEHSSCSACNRLVCSRLTGGGVTYDDGRIVCNICRKTAVDSKEQAKPIVENVARWLYDRGIRFENLKLKINLDNGRQLKLNKAEKSSPTGPWQGQRIGYIVKATHFRGGRSRRIIKGVTILSGMPQELFEGTVVHELGHAWIYLARVDRLPLWAEEGFCNLLSYILHKERNTKEARHWVKALEKNPDPIYGEGFRRVRAIFKKHGFGKAINYTYQHKKFPPE